MPGVLPASTLELNLLMDFADDIDEDFESDSDQIRHCFPFLWLDNGDRIALYLKEASHPVYYIAFPEGFVRKISPSLGDFLFEWRKVFYIGPDYDTIRRWLGDDSELKCDDPVAKFVHDTICCRPD